MRIQLKTTNHFMFTEYTQRAQTVGDEAEKSIEIGALTVTAYQCWCRCICDCVVAYVRTHMCAVIEFRTVLFVCTVCHIEI